TGRKDWLDLIGDRAAADRVFLELELNELRRSLAWAKQRMVGVDARLLLGLGNDDLTPMEEVIAADGFAELTDREILRLDDAHELLTLAYSNPTPWKTHRELPEEAIALRIDSDASRLADVHRSVFNLHVPPHNTPLDLAPRLDPNFVKVMTPGGEPDMVHVGSTAVRSAIERYQPLLGLHGHIHESKGSVRIGATTAINPGSAYIEGTLLGVVVDLAKDGIRSTMMTAG
ncbi:MAG: metallophosphoesterase, partial [Thermoplasmata archaeon]